MTERSELEKCLVGEPFESSAPELIEMIVQARKLTGQYNQLAADDLTARTHILQQLLGGLGDQVYIDTPFYCDYGKHIFIGDHVYIGLNCTFVDNNHIHIGDNALIGSGVNISTASHPVEASQRILEHDGKHQGYATTSAPVRIGEGAWVGSSATILSGISIGKNTTIGAGSVVTKNIPDNCVAVGNPCRVLRSI
ncbi:sugar O-acetyltransferase [Verrucomicrobiaceae bacterium N1E253]|uniref:Nodulation protein L n=1 Tax=Oceaniferula marina TaxID=2748318 RepID=A0A851GE85_9BACT|nr:sugar O-acetyltransferase [Oceaniferula marina]NWK55232.1 sugar O-acetyltransferase [Oceaniferula marina]